MGHVIPMRQTVDKPWVPQVATVPWACTMDRLTPLAADPSLSSPPSFSYYTIYLKFRPWVPHGVPKRTLTPHVVYVEHRAG